MLKKSEGIYLHIVSLEQHTSVQRAAEKREQSRCDLPLHVGPGKSPLDRQMRKQHRCQLAFDILKFVMRINRCESVNIVHGYMPRKSKRGAKFGAIVILPYAQSPR